MLAGGYPHSDCMSSFPVTGSALDPTSSHTNQLPAPPSLDWPVVSPFLPSINSGGVGPMLTTEFASSALSSALTETSSRCQFWNRRLVVQVLTQIPFRGTSLDHIVVGNTEAFEFLRPLDLRPFIVSVAPDVITGASVTGSEAAELSSSDPNKLMQ